MTTTLITENNDPGIFEPFLGETITVATADDQLTGRVVDAWPWFTGDALGIRFDSPKADAAMVLPADETWTITRAGERAPALKHVPQEADTASPASVQHYIDTGRYLTHAEVAEDAAVKA